MVIEKEVEAAEKMAVVDLPAQVLVQESMMHHYVALASDYRSFLVAVAMMEPGYKEFDQ